MNHFSKVKPSFSMIYGEVNLLVLSCPFHLLLLPLAETLFKHEREKR